MASLEEVAGLAHGLVRGVNWSELAERGKNSVYSVEYIYDYLIPASDRATATMRKLDLAVADKEKAFEAFREVYHGIVNLSGEALLDAARAGVDMLTEPAAPHIAKDAYRYMIDAAYTTAMYGISLHLPPLDWKARGISPIGSIHFSGLSEADIAQHANMVFSLFDGIALLDRVGALAPIKKPEFSTSGLGGAPAVALVIGGVVVVLLAVGVTAVICWFLLAMMDTSTKNRLVRQMCEQAQNSGDTKATAQCIDVLSDPDKQIATAPFRAAATMGQFGFETVAKYAMIGAGVYALVVFAPVLVRQFKATREATKA